MEPYEPPVWSFGYQTQPSPWNLDRGDVAAKLLSLLLNPDLIDQDGFGCCGEVAFLRAWAYRDPANVANFAIRLFDQGNAPIDGSSYTVKAASNLLSSTYIKSNNNSAITSAVWMIAGALADTEDDYLPKFSGNWQDRNSMSLSTLTSEVTGWLNHSGVYQNVNADLCAFKNSTGTAVTVAIDILTGLPLPNLSGSKTINDALRLRPAPDMDVILAINTNMFRELVSCEPPGLTADWHGGINGIIANHWIMLQEPIQDLGNGQVRMNLWTWGGTYQVVLTKDSFNNNYYGAISAQARANCFHNGVLVREPNGAIWVIYGGAKFHIPDPATEARLFPNVPYHALASAAVNAIPTIPRDGTLLREENGAIWVIYGGAKFHVPDPGTLSRVFGNTPWYQLWNGALDAIPTMPDDGMLLREENGAIWVIDGGAKFHVPDPATLVRLYAATPWRQVWNGALNAIPAIPVDGTLLREENGAIWVIYGGTRYHVPNMDVFNRLFSTANVRQVWNGALAGIPTTTADATLLADQSDTYAIFGGAKLRVPKRDPGNDYNPLHMFPGVPVYQLWNEALDGFAAVPADGTVLRDEYKAYACIIEKGQRMMAPADAAARAHTVWGGALDNIPIASGTIAGTVRGPDGPVAGAAMGVYYLSIQYGSNLATTINTDTKGQYRVNVDCGVPCTFNVTAAGLVSGPDTVTASSTGVTNHDILLTRIVYGTIVGTVTGAKGATLQDAFVMLAGRSQSSRTDAHGNYELDKVPSGPAQVTASMSHYMPRTNYVTVAGNQTARADISLDLAVPGPIPKPDPGPPPRPKPQTQT